MALQVAAAPNTFEMSCTLLVKSPLATFLDTATCALLAEYEGVLEQKLDLKVTFAFIDNSLDVSDNLLLAAMQVIQVTSIGRSVIAGYIANL